MKLKRADLYRGVEDLAVDEYIDFDEASYPALRMFLSGHKAKYPHLKYRTKRISIDDDKRRIWRVV